MYRWKVWFRDPPHADGLPLLTTVQCHGYRHCAWRRQGDWPDATWFIYIIRSGGLRWPTDGRWMVPGDAILVGREQGLAPGPEGTGRSGPADFAYLQFRPGPLAETCARLTARGAIVRLDPEQPPLLGLMAWHAVYDRMVAANRSRRGDTPVVDVAPGMGLRVIGSLLAEFAGAGKRPDDPWISRAIEVHDTARRHDLTATVWAKLVGCSRKHLSERFRDAGLAPPGQWLARRRLDQADKLLAEGMRPGEIARRLGYADAGSLARARRRWARIST
jgi:AraC-like DNA-binding protein